jgi:dTDP-glucose pyrophosphorylase
MAGAGSRFQKQGYLKPKPLIPIHTRPMIEVVIENLRPKCKHKFIFICQKSHVDAYGLKAKLKQWAPGCEIVEIIGLTDGAARTVLEATDFINNDDPLMIANSDQYIDFSIERYLANIEVDNLSGLIMTMTADATKWSYVGLDKNSLVTRVVEKEVISNEATVGIYNFSEGRLFVDAANSMISKNLLVNGEFYVAPAYNELIGSGHKIGVYNVGEVGDGMYGLGTPEDLDIFLKNNVSHAAVSGL